MDENLSLLAEKLGIDRCFSDAGLSKKNYEVSDDVVKFFCTQYGFSVKTPEDIETSLQRAEDYPWKRTLDNIIILRQGNLQFTAVLDQARLNEAIEIRIFPRYVAESGIKTESVPFVMNVLEEKNLSAGRKRVKVSFTLQKDIAYGYYDLVLECGDEKHLSVLAVAPAKCYTTPDVDSAKLWGFSLQLYSLKSRRNWGVGDFTDLADFISLCAKNGADVIGLNPLNVLAHDFPEDASPYSSVSRLFLNPIYIDVENVPGFDIICDRFLQQEIEAAKVGELIDYTKVYELKIKVLEKLFNRMQKYGQYYDALQKFKQEKGHDLDMLATYQALCHVQLKSASGGWHTWEKNLQNPQSLKVAEFKKNHQDLIEFFKYLQFEADRQLKNVYKKIQESGLKIGLYRDLPVGVGKDSAELWADNSVFMKGSGAGAPPDAFFPQGQKWCLGAFNPYELKNRAYEPYLKILRANMAYAGALRIDQLIGLLRFFMIPDEQNEGTYIYYNFEDMLNLLALESHLHKCVIVGESIGNVPEGFLDKIEDRNIYAISVLWSERWNGDGDFKRPEDYPANAFVSVGTHDMSPLKMWWYGYDIELKCSLKIITEEERQGAYKMRESDRYKLLSALDLSQSWPMDRPRRGNYLYGEGYPEGIEEAAHKFLAKASSKVVMLQPEDIFGVDVQQNLPGTDRHQYSNWQHRLPVDLEDFENSDAFRRNVNAVKSERKL